MRRSKPSAICPSRINSPMVTSTLWLPRRHCAQALLGCGSQQCLGPGGHRRQCLGYRALLDPGRQRYIGRLASPCSMFIDHHLGDLGSIDSCISKGLKFHSGSYSCAPVVQGSGVWVIRGRKFPIGKAAFPKGPGGPLLSNQLFSLLFHY